VSRRIVAKALVIRGELEEKSSGKESRRVGGGDRNILLLTCVIFLNLGEEKRGSVGSQADYASAEGGVPKGDEQRKGTEGRTTYSEHLLGRVVMEGKKGEGRHDRGAVERE